MLFIELAILLKDNFLWKKPTERIMRAKKRIDTNVNEETMKIILQITQKIKTHIFIVVGKNSIESEASKEAA